MTIHSNLVLLAHSFFQIFCQFQAVQIRHTAALGTDKVCMGFCMPIEPLLTVDYAHTFNYPLLLKEQKIAVHGAKAQVGVLGFQSLVQPLCGRVAVRILNDLKERLSFFAVSNCFRHSALNFFLCLLTIIIIIYDMIVAYAFLFVKRKFVDF